MQSPLTVVPVPGCAPSFRDGTPSASPDKEVHHLVGDGGRCQVKWNRSVQGVCIHMICQTPDLFGPHFSLCIMRGLNRRFSEFSPSFKGECI